MAQRDRLAREVVNINEEERRRISPEHHDWLCQKFFGTRLYAKALKKRFKKDDAGKDLAVLSALFDGSVAEARRTAFGR